MGEPINPALAVEPSEWFVVFHRKSTNRVLSFLAFGEFKHVSAFGYYAGFKAWLIYDVQWRGTRLLMIPHSEDGKQIIAGWTDDCEIVKIARGEKRSALSSRIGLYCVSAIKHLIGLRCVAVTPSDLYRHILRNGGMLIDGRARPTDPGRSEPS
jgi:hypothetical protein